MDFIDRLRRKISALRSRRRYKKRDNTKQQRVYTSRKTPHRQLKASRAYPYVKILICLVLVAVIALVSVFVIVPWAKNKFAEENNMPDQNYYQEATPKESEKVIAGKDMTELQSNAKIKNSTINDPFMCGNEIVFSSAVSSGGVQYYKALNIYNTVTQETEQITVKIKYDNILSTKLTEDFIVWIDSNDDGGGRICMYDRKTQEQFTVKEYAFAVPTVNISGNTIIFMQQAGDDLDKLYIFDLETRESVCVELFSGLPTAVTTADISEKDFVYAVPYTQGDAYRSRVYKCSLDSGERTQMTWSTYTMDPLTDGKYIVFSSMTAGLGTRTLYVDKGKNSPIIIEENVTNYGMGDGFVAYTKDEVVYVYVIATGENARLSSTKTRGLLASVNGKNVCWYDITSGYKGVDILKYAVVEW